MDGRAVQVHHAGLQLVNKMHGELEIIGKNGRREPIDGVVGERKSVIRVMGLGQWCRAPPKICIQHFLEDLNMDNKQIVAKLVECWNTGKLGIVDEVLAPNFIRHEPDIGGPTTNRDAYKETVTRHRDRLANFHTESTDIIEQGNKVAFRFKTTGKSGNAPVVFEGVNILRVEGGKVVEDWAYFDATGVKDKIKQQKAA